MCDSGSCVSTSFPPTTPREGTRYLPYLRGRRIVDVQNTPQYDGSTPEQIPIASPIRDGYGTAQPSRSCPRDELSTASGPTCDTPIALPNDLATCLRPNGSRFSCWLIPHSTAATRLVAARRLHRLQACWRLQISPQDVFVSGRMHLSTHVKIMSTISYIVYVHLTWCHTTNLRDSSGRFCAIRSLHPGQSRVQSALPVRGQFRHRAVRRVLHRPDRVSATVMSPRCPPV